MQVRAIVGVLFAAGLFSTAIFAQPTPIATPQQGVDVEHLNDVPNPGAVLLHQWSPGLPADVARAENATSYYGGLQESGVVQPMSLPEAIALAIEHNTQLQIDRLGPVSAIAQVRGAYAAFDPVIFADVSKQRVVNPASSIGIFTTGNTTADRVPDPGSGDDANPGWWHSSRRECSRDFSGRLYLGYWGAQTPAHRWRAIAAVVE